MTKQEYTSWESLDKHIKVAIHSHLFACSILHPNNDKSANNRVMKEFHDAVCTNNPQFPDDKPIIDVYTAFFKWLQRGEHNESTYNIFNHVRAFKTWWNETNKPSLKYYQPPKPVEIPLRSGKDGRRELNLTNEKLMRTKEIMEWMDTQKPVAGTIASKMASGRKWTEFTFYKDAVYTLEKRGLIK